MAGGKREGAGRPLGSGRAIKKIAISTHLEPETITTLQWFRKHRKIKIGAFIDQSVKLLKDKLLKGLEEK